MFAHLAERDSRSDKGFGSAYCASRLRALPFASDASDNHRVRDGPRARGRGVLAIDAGAFLLALAVLAFEVATVERLDVVVVAATMLAYFGMRIALGLARRRR